MTRATTATIRVENGNAAGMSFPVTAEGVRIGRSSKNDIVLSDPLLSRYHCRLFIRDGGLWVADLGSANNTLLNDVPVTEVPVYAGNRIAIGDTLIQVLTDGRDASVDLGLAPRHPSPGDMRSRRKGWLMAAGFAGLVLAGGVWIMQNPGRASDPDMRHTGTPGAGSENGNPGDAVGQEDSLRILYEKVDASPSNIFRYTFSITPPNGLTLSVEDLMNNRRLKRSKEIGAAVVEDLMNTVRESGFFEMEPVYRGIAPGVLEERTLTAILGRKAHTIRVSNRVPPEWFANLCGKLESVGKVELGFWAIQYSAGQLIAMAETALLQGKKLSVEREVAPGNLAAAIASLNEAEWLLETVDTKPDYYAEILAVRRDAIEALNTRYEEIHFQAERAMRLRDWEGAAEQLRLLLDLIPDREDERHRAARKQLLEVDARRERT